MHVGDLWLSNDRGYTKDKIVDSEYALQLFTQAYQNSNSKNKHPIIREVNKMTRAFKIMLNTIKKEAISLFSANIVIQFESILIISRYSTSPVPPPMYYRINYFGKNNIIVCHEPLDYDKNGWEIFPANHLLVAFKIENLSPKKNSLYYQFISLNRT